MNDRDKIRLIQIEEEISKNQKKKTTGIILVIISLFCLWPLMIVGIILWANADKSIKKLEKERADIQIGDINNSSREYGQDSTDDFKSN